MRTKLVLAILFIFVSCIGFFIFKPATPVVDLSFESEKYTVAYSIIKNRCSGCHGEYLGYSEKKWIENKLVIPSAPKKSELFRYLRGANVGGAENMPPKSSLLPEELKHLRNWITHLPKLENYQLTNSRFKIPKKITGHANSQLVLTAEEHYYRCYSHLVRERPDSDDPLLLKIQKKQLDSTSACMELLKLAEFSNSGRLKKETTNSIKILRTLNNFHNTWFPAFLVLRPFEMFLTYDISELETSAYFVTRALFQPGAHYSQVVTAESAYEGIRKASVAPDYALGMRLEKKPELKSGNFFHGLAFGQQQKWQPKILERGPLIGLRQIPVGRDMLPRYVDDSILPELFNRPLDIHASLGGGVMGTNPYLLFNSGRNAGEKMDGARLLPRRWGKAILRDLLCRELPVVQPKDAHLFVQKSSSVSFRSGTSCMQCHASMDHLGALARNMELVYSNNEAGKWPTNHVKFHPNRSEFNTSIWTESNPNYHQGKTEGIFYFRNLYGELINEKLNNLKELGELLAGSDDLYVCAAKRYFQFFTGINIKIEDFSISEGNASIEEQQYLRMIIGLGKSLKEHQSLAKLIESIIDSPTYKQRDYKITWKK
ncbi:MAG: hypothetical protein HN509_02660 [Halobacteriovoraceae bacterium]|nr:hypothetical protein [Halobacteriovoraceae bacterium]